MTRRRNVPGDGLLDPIAIGAISILVLNDHWWKRAYPSFLTGKISDFAGLVFFPLLLVAAFEVLSRAKPSRRAVVVSVIATAIVFALAKTWTPMNVAVRLADGALHWPLRWAMATAQGARTPPLVLASLVRDPTDLLALPALLVALRLGLRRVNGTASAALLARVAGGESASLTSLLGRNAVSSIREEAAAADVVREVARSRGKAAR